MVKTALSPGKIKELMLEKRFVLFYIPDHFDYGISKKNV